MWDLDLDLSGETIPPRSFRSADTPAAGHTNRSNQSIIDPSPPALPANRSIHRIGWPGCYFIQHNPRSPLCPLSSFQRLGTRTRRTTWTIHAEISKQTKGRRMISRPVPSNTPKHDTSKPPTAIPTCLFCKGAPRVSIFFRLNTSRWVDTQQAVARLSSRRPRAWLCGYGGGRAHAQS